LATTDAPNSNSTSEIPRYIRWLKNGFMHPAKNTEKALEGTPFKIPVIVLNMVFDLANVRHPVINHEYCKDL
jgi:hypothetical protein